jgi:hypothetical protein
MKGIEHGAQGKNNGSPPEAASLCAMRHVLCPLRFPLLYGKRVAEKTVIDASDERLIVFSLDNDEII